jgi:pre-rRNA-processing protein IPI1
MAGKTKSQKLQDFNKSKPRLGKAKPKAANSTSTTFKARSIFVGNQLRFDADGNNKNGSNLNHHLAVACTARSDVQRHAALCHITKQTLDDRYMCATVTRSVLTKLLPLVLDTSSSVRKQLLVLLKALPIREVSADTARILVFVRAGLTHLSSDISNDALSLLTWLLDVAPYETIVCQGGWLQTLRSLCSILGWSSPVDGGWSDGKNQYHVSIHAKPQAERLTVLARLLNIGLQQDPAPDLKGVDFNVWSSLMFTSAVQCPVLNHLEITAGVCDDDLTEYIHRESRQHVLATSFLDTIQDSASLGSRDASIARSALASVLDVISRGMADYETDLYSSIEEIAALW